MSCGSAATVIAARMIGVDPKSISEGLVRKRLGTDLQTPVTVSTLAKVHGMQVTGTDGKAYRLNVQIAENPYQAFLDAAKSPNQAAIGLFHWGEPVGHFSVGWSGEVVMEAKSGKAVGFTKINIVDPSELKMFTIPSSHFDIAASVIISKVPVK